MTEVDDETGKRNGFFDAFDFKRGNSLRPLWSIFCTISFMNEKFDEYDQVKTQKLN